MIPILPEGLRQRPEIEWHRNSAERFSFVNLCSTGIMNKNATNVENVAL
jgi:hypothetical protein